MIFLNTEEFFQNFPTILKFSYSNFFKGLSYITIRLISRKRFKSNLELRCKNIFKIDEF